MRIIIVSCFVFLLACSFASAAVLADYPDIFLKDNKADAVIVVGSERGYDEINAANYILNSLSANTRVPRTSRYSIYSHRPVYDLPKTVADEQVNNIFTTNAIVIGTPCHNSKVRQLLGISEQNCASAVQHKGYLRLIEHPSGARQLVITGSDPAFVLHAAKYLANARYDYRLRTKAVSVSFAYVSYRPQGFLSIGETLGNEMPAVYSGYPFVSYMHYK